MLPLVYPAAPTGLTATGGNAQVNLNWMAVTGAADVLSYNIRRATISGGAYTIIATNIGLISYLDTNVVNGTTYYYIVSAVNPLGESSDSLEVSGIPFTGVASANSGNPPNETAAMAFDGLASTKWYDGVTPPGWLQYYLGGVSKAVVSYSLTSANDVPQRDPMNWQFQGSMDGLSWTTLDTQTGQVFASRFQAIQYNISNITAYKYYRLNILANNGGNGYGLQLAELSFTYSTPPVVSTTPPILSFAASDGQIQFSWPSDHMGWQLETQTNSTGLGLSKNWELIPNSNVTNHISIPINAINDSVFFRLTYP